MTKLKYLVESIADVPPALREYYAWHDGKFRLNCDVSDQIRSKDETIARLSSSIIDVELSRALTNAGVSDPVYLEAVLAMLKPNVEVSENNGARIARMKPELGGSDIATYVSNWVQGDEGKLFVSSPTGADVKGDNNRSSEPNPWSKEQWNITQQGRMIRTDRAKAERLAKAAGFRDLDHANKAVRPLVA